MCEGAREGCGVKGSIRVGRSPSGAGTDVLASKKHIENGRRHGCYCMSYDIRQMLFESPVVRKGLLKLSRGHR